MPPEITTPLATIESRAVPTVLPSPRTNLAGGEMLCRV